MYEVKTENVYDDFSKNKEMFEFSNYSAKSKYCDESKALVVRKMKDEMDGVAIEEFVRLKPKICTTLVSDSSEFKKPKAVNKNFVAKISHNEYKGVLINKTCLTINRSQRKSHRIGTYEINEISLYCFDDKIHILDNGNDAFAFGL